MFIHWVSANHFICQLLVANYCTCSSISLAIQLIDELLLADYFNYESNSFSQLFSWFSYYLITSPLITAHVTGGRMTEFINVLSAKVSKIQSANNQYWIIHHSLLLPDLDLLKSPLPLYWLSEEKGRRPPFTKGFGPTSTTTHQSVPPFIRPLMARLKDCLANIFNKARD